MKSYAGIGSREITMVEEETMRKIASIMREKGYVLYSGGAPGSDAAFESGCSGVGISFRPWPGFGECYDAIRVMHHSKESLDSVKVFHPNYKLLSPAVNKLMSRNYHQIYGIEPNFPKVDLVICCANEKNGLVQGGTGQAVRIATAAGIPVINIRKNPFWQKELMMIKETESFFKARYSRYVTPFSSADSVAAN